MIYYAAGCCFRRGCSRPPLDAPNLPPIHKPGIHNDNNDNDTTTTTTNNNNNDINDLNNMFNL